MQVKSDFEVPYNIKQNVRVRKQNKFKDIKSRKQKVVMHSALSCRVACAPFSPDFKLCSESCNWHFGCESVCI